MLKTRTAPAAPERRRHTGRKLAAAASAGVLLMAVALHSVLLTVLAVLTAVTLGVLVLRARWARYRAGGRVAARRRRKHQGWATAREIRRKLSPGAARRKARVIYPAVNPASAAVRIGRTRRRMTIAGTWADTYLLLAPPQTLKTALLAGWAADAPGALLATSSRGDIWRHSATARPGDVRVLNASGTPGIPCDFAWSPVAGCRDTEVATRRAADLMAASPRDPGGKDAWHEDRGGRLLRYMLHTADLVGADMHDVREWIQAVLTSSGPLEIMAASADPRWARALESLIVGAGEHLGAVISSAEAALGWMDSTVMSAAACPPPGQGIDAAEFTAGNGSAYLISEDREQASPAPYFAAFTAEVFYQARVRAEHHGGRLPVPLTLALDELPTIVPVPFHKWSSVAAGYNVCLIGCVQAPPQIAERWGEQNAATIWSNSKIKVVGGGFTHPDDLESLSKLCGDTDTWHLADGGARVHEVRRLCPPEMIRLLDADRWEALVLHRNARPARVTITPVWDRPGYRKAVPAPARLPVPQLAIEPLRREAIPMPGRPASIPGHLRKAAAEPDPVPVLTGTVTEEIPA
jgi:type IV secretion system protein VirD4